MKLLSDSTRKLVLKNGDHAYIRTMTLGDIDTVVALERGAGAHPWSENNFRDSLTSSHHCLLLEKNGTAMAHAIFSLAADEAELLVLAVHKSQQGQGVASAFLTECFALLAPFANELFLEVRQSNLPAITLYEHLGFNQVGERRHYYPAKNGREDALIFALVLFDELSPGV